MPPRLEKPNINVPRANLGFNWSQKHQEDWPVYTVDHARAGVELIEAGYYVEENDYRIFSPNFAAVRVFATESLY